MRPTEPATAPSRRRAWLFRIAAVAWIPVLLLLAEGGLRLAAWPLVPAPRVPESWGESTRVVTPASRSDFLERAPGPDGAVTVRTAAQLRDEGFMQAEAWILPKPEGSFRVFCFGGSATLGVPIEKQPERTFPGQLEARLVEAGLDAEVINLGGASYASDQVVELLGQVMAHQPDALVVYSGNNEFFEYALELAALNPEPASVLAPGSALHLVRLLHRVRPPPVVVPAERELAQRALVAAAVRASLRELGPTGWEVAGTERVDRPYHDVMARFGDNLWRMASLAAEAAVPLYLVEVPANLLEPPYLPGGHPNLGPVGAWRRDRSLERGRALLDQQDHLGAVPALDEAVGLDALHAEARYLRGLARLRAGEMGPALEDLRAALWLEPAPGRPLPVQTERLESAARHFDTTRFVPTATAFETAQLAAGDRGHFHDVCHLTPEGQALLARKVARALLADHRPPVDPGEGEG